MTINESFLDKIEIVEKSRPSGDKKWAIGMGPTLHGAFKTKKEAIDEVKPRIEATIELLQETLKKMEEDV